MRKNKIIDLNKIFNTPANPLLLRIMAICIIVCFSQCSKDTTTDDEKVGDWARKSEFEGVGRTEAVSFVVDDKVYVGGGYDGDDRLTDFWLLDDATGTWYQKANFPGTPRNSAISFSINGKGYIGTGIDEDDNKLKDFWQYDPTSDTWTQLADFPGTARYNAVGFSINSKGYISTGYDGNYLKDLWEYDPGNDTWTQKASLGGSKRSEAVSFVYDNKAYILTGTNNGSLLNDFWVYDPANNSWEEKRKLTDATDNDYDDDYDYNIVRKNAIISVMGNKAYLTSGNNGSAIASTWEYDISSDTWDEKTSFEGTAREGALGFTVRSNMYIVTGNNSSYEFDDMWQFFPAAEQDDNNN
ncbi:MAG TPA: kelch repeat-containing protein [Ferruginibacter sp.]|nr:kelch repeat-containing protein [Ferruginibacter sp.]